MTNNRDVVVSKMDLLRIKVINMLREGAIKEAEAAATLGLSRRQIRRLKKKAREGGPEALLHQGRGRVPTNKKSDMVRQKYLRLYQNIYANFNFKHAHEMILLNEQISADDQVSYPTFARWCRQAGLGKIRRRRVSKARVARERMSEEGAMLQLDGSTHEWRRGSGEKDCLIAFIDDATSIVPSARLHDGETTWACLEGLREVVEAKGIPQAILTDQAGWAARGDKRVHFSQFARACEELGILLITTPIAETKGRIERMNRTWQDRLVAELEFYRITTQLDSNRYIDQKFKPQWNDTFSVEPRSSTTRYRSVAPHLELDQIFCLKYNRQGTRDNTVSFEGSRYRLLNREFGSLNRKEITIHKHKDGRLEFFYGRHQLDVEKIKPIRQRWRRSA